jgi:hypothetical protein
MLQQLLKGLSLLWWINSILQWALPKALTMRDQGRISGDHITEQYATAMLQKLANDANALDWLEAFSYLIHGYL